jgi:hypothetical protein
METKMKRGRRLAVMVGCDDHLETFVEILELPTSTTAGMTIMLHPLQPG